MNRKLKSAIILRFDNQGDAAQALGLAESRLSRLIRERVRPSDKELKAFARVFGAEKANALLVESDDDGPLAA